MFPTLQEALIFTLMGLIGGFINVLASVKSVRDLNKFSAGRCYVLGLAAGFLYSFLFSEYTYPNALMSVVVGYAVSDFIVSLAERLGKKD